MDSDIQVCLISHDQDLIDISFLQITQTDSLGVESTDVIINGNGEAASVIISQDNGLSSGVIVLSSDIFDSEATSITLFGMATGVLSEISFQVDLELPNTDSQAMSDYDPFSEMNLSTTKEVGTYLVTYCIMVLYFEVYNTSLPSFLHSSCILYTCDLKHPVRWM